MPFITFIYKVGHSSKVYYGKYCTDYISNDHDGLDLEVRYSLIKGLNLYREKNNMPKVKKISVGIISCMIEYNVPIYSTPNEIKCFDFYCDDIDGKIYINGKLLD